MQFINKLKIVKVNKYLKVFMIIIFITSIWQMAANIQAKVAKKSPQENLASLSISKREKLDRGLKAIKTAEGVFLSWRLLFNEAAGYSSQGLTGVDFNIYRDGKKIGEVKDSTNYLDKTTEKTSKYSVKAVLNRKVIDQSKEVKALENNYFDLELKKPADGVTPAGEHYTYLANDMSVGDVDNDGQYEYFVKWDPSNSKDVSQKGYTGYVYLDCYELDGTILYRYDLGVNIRAGAHYTQFIVYDFDGDGEAEVMFKTAPGTKIIQYNKDGSVKSEKYIKMPKSDLKAGYKNTDDYRLSKDDYYNHVVKMFMNWQNMSEVKNGNWPQTLEKCFGIEDKYSYPLNEEAAKSLATYFMDVYAPDRSAKNLLREFEGFIIDGPEYLSIFSGKNGKELKTVHYKPGRTDDGLLWGDYATTRIEPANRVDRFLAGVAYLDGKKPSAIFARGYYTRSTIVSYNWDGQNLKENWFIDSGHISMKNPFNDSPHGGNGSNKDFGELTTQGAHTLSVADVDQDDRDEIIYGSSTIDDNGKILYNSAGLMPEGNKSAGKMTRLGHGDSIHVADIDPDRDGLEIFMCHEGAENVPYGFSLREAKTGIPIFGSYIAKDVGRCMIGDIDPAVRGMEIWSTANIGSNLAELFSCQGQRIDDKIPGTNFNIKWHPNMSTQILDGANTVTPSIIDWYKGNILTATDTISNNGTKGNPALVADVFGDWREELLLRKADNSAIRIFINDELTNHKLYTLMHDRQYRTGIARQNVVYNQPVYPSFYLATDMDWSKVPVIKKYYK